HDVARLDGHFGNAFLQHFGQIPGAFLRVLRGLYRLSLEELLVNRPPRYTIWGRHRRMFDTGPIDLSEQFPGCIPVVTAAIFSVKHDADADVICDFLVHVLGLVSRDKVGCASADRIPAHGTQMLVSVTGAVHTYRQV